MVADFAPHLVPVRNREHRLRGNDVRQADGKRGARRGSEVGLTGIAGRAAETGDAAVPKHIGEAECHVQERRRIPRRELASGAERARAPRPHRASADRERQRIRGIGERTVAGRAGDVAVSAQLLVEEEGAAEVYYLRTGRRERADRHDTPPRQLGAELRVERRRWRGTDAATGVVAALTSDSHEQHRTQRRRT